MKLVIRRFGFVASQARALVYQKGPVLSRLRVRSAVREVMGIEPSPKVNNYCSLAHGIRAYRASMRIGHNSVSLSRIAYSRDFKVTKDGYARDSELNFGAHQ